nr:MAG TPA: hypothetical protein [Caudoviricetes sp.]
MLYEKIKPKLVSLHERLNSALYYHSNDRNCFANMLFLRLYRL